MSNPISFSSITVDADGITGFNQQRRKLFVSMEEIQAMEIVRGKVSQQPKIQLVIGIASMAAAVVLLSPASLFLIALGVRLIYMSRQKELVLIVITEDGEKRLSLGKEIAVARLYRFIESMRETFGLEITPPKPTD